MGNDPTPATVTPSQIEFFHKLTTDRQFPDGADVAKLRTEFATLDKASASLWIDRAVNLPKLSPETGGPLKQPSF